MKYYNIISIKISLFTCLLILFTSACDNILEPNPRSFTSTANFYNTPEHFNLAINGLYGELRSIVGENYQHMTELRADNVTRHFDINLPASGSRVIERFEMPANNSHIENQWANIYSTISQANVIIGRIENVVFNDETQKNLIVGQAKFIRAFAYWQAVQFWGDIPVVLKEVTNPNEAFPEDGRLSTEIVYQQIISDLEIAIDRLPRTWTGSDIGRITEGAAKFLLARTYLLTGEFDNALIELNELEQFGYELLPNYRDIFNPSNKNNLESIFEIQFGSNITGQPHSDMVRDVLPWNSRGEIAPTILNPRGRYMPPHNTIEAFENGDEREEASINWYINSENAAFPEVAHGDSIPYYYKFLWLDHINDLGQDDNNWIVFRYADVILSKAEANWKLGNSEEATDYINLVRERAGLSELILSDYSGEITGDPLGDAILHERNIELLGEGHRWLDLLRFGNNVTLHVMNTYGESRREIDPLASGSYIVEDYMLLYPIPINDVTRSGLTQNPGW